MMCRTKANFIYRRAQNLRAVQLLPRHTKLESNVRYPGIEVVDALEMSVAVSRQVSRRPSLNTAVSSLIQATCSSSWAKARSGLSVSSEVTCCRLSRLI